MTAPPIRFNTAFLEMQVDMCAGIVGIDPTTWAEFRATIAELKEHNEFMYAHSLRVGLYCYGLAAYEGQSDMHFPLFAGCGHDVGKCEISNHLLDSKNLQPEEFEEIKRHSTEGFERLRGSFLFTAFIAGLHHRFRAGGYGIDLDEVAPDELSDESKELIIAMAKLVMIADFFDALTTRENNKGFIAHPNDPAEQRSVMTQHFPDSPERISWLIEHRII